MTPVLVAGEAGFGGADLARELRENRPGPVQRAPDHLSAGSLGGLGAFHKGRPLGSVRGTEGSEATILGGARCRQSVM